MHKIRVHSWINPCPVEPKFWRNVIVKSTIVDAIIALKVTVLQELFYVVILSFQIFELKYCS